jgi:hypothetical protein
MHAQITTTWVQMCACVHHCTGGGAMLVLQHRFDWGSRTQTYNVLSFVSALHSSGSTPVIVAGPMLLHHSQAVVDWQAPSQASSNGWHRGNHKQGATAAASGPAAAARALCPRH